MVTGRNAALSAALLALGAGPMAAAEAPPSPARARLR